MQQTYLTTDELSGRIKYDPRTIRERMLDSVLLEGVHYIRPFGGRKILFIWERIEEDMALASKTCSMSPNLDEPSTFDEIIPMANGGTCHVAKGLRVSKQTRRNGSASKEVGHG